jgi:ribose 5-phosphate isomerase A
MDQIEQKRAAAQAAVDYVQAGTIVGVGTGSTVAFFIAALAELPAERRPSAAVASSEATAAALRAAGFPVVELASLLPAVGVPADSGACPLPLYVDGADEADPQLRLIKGAGGALTREKILASAARLFVCIVDESKLVARLGAAPVPLEVVPMAVESVAAHVTARGARPAVRPGYLTDNGNAVLDVQGLDLADPEGAEVELNTIPGVLECGIFARRRADLVLAGGPGGVATHGLSR